MTGTSLATFPQKTDPELSALLRRDMRQDAARFLSDPFSD